MNEAVLARLLETETQFDVEIALKLLNSFYIIHELRQQDGHIDYIIPYFSSDYMNREWQQDGYVQLRAEIEFNGLALPQYVYQLITVAVLKFRPDPTHSVKLAKNGTTIRHGSNSTHLIHNYINRQVTIQISTPVELIGSSWQRLIELAHYIIDNTTAVWKASRPEIVIYCSHCLFIRNCNPDCHVNPSWFKCSHHEVADDNQHTAMTYFSGIEPVKCANAELTRHGEFTVLKPLKFPCKLTGSF